MLRRKCILVCTLNMLCVFFAFGQSKNGDIEGYVKNFDNQPIGYASVFLLNASDSSVLKFAITNPAGLYRFNSISPGKYLINTTCTGYKSKLSATFLAGKGSTITVNVIQLNKKSTGIAEILVVESRSFMDVKPGKTTLNIQNSSFALGGSALSILKMAPGVQVDANDNVLLNGKADVLILIDNKPAYVSGQALADLLQSTQSSMIDKIDILTSPNASHDAASTGGVINIRMVRDKNIGFSALVSGITGVVDPGSINYDNQPKGSVGANFNYRTKKANIFGNYFYNSFPSFKSSMSDRVNNYNGVVKHISDDWFIDQRRKTNNFRLGADYNLNSNHVIGFLVSGLFVNLSGPKNTRATIGSLAAVDSTILTHSELKRTISNFVYNVNYRGNLGKKSSLTFDVDYINYDRRNNENIWSNYYNNNTANTLYRTLMLQNSSPSNYDVLVINAGYHLDINNKSDFTAGFKDSYIRTDNVSDFDVITNGVYTSLPEFAGRFKYTEKLRAAFVDYNRVLSKKASIELGLRVEQTVSTGRTPDPKDDFNNNYFDFFPNIQYNLNSNKNNQFKLSYARAITRPKYEELNPFTQYNNQYTYQKGNPYLKPYYSNTIQLAHTYKSRFSTALSFAVINGFTQTIFMQNDQTQITTLKKVNLGNRYNYDAVFTAPVNVAKFYAVDVNLDILYQRFTGMNGALDNGSYDVTFKTNHHIKLPFNIRSDILAVYETPTTFGILRYKSNINVNGAVSMSVLQKQVTIQFQVDNIFRSDKNVYTSNYQNLNIRGNQPNSFRLFQLSVSYALGSKTIKAARKNTGADDEQIRVGNGSN